LLFSAAINIDPPVAKDTGDVVFNSIVDDFNIQTTTTGTEMIVVSHNYGSWSGGTKPGDIVITNFCITEPINFNFLPVAYEHTVPRQCSSDITTILSNTTVDNFLVHKGPGIILIPGMV